MRSLAVLTLALSLLPVPGVAQAGSAPGAQPAKRSHPFLIVTRDQFPALRQKATQEPWKSMKADALARSAKGSKTSAYDLQAFVGAAALAYILDEADRQTHAHRVRDAILQQYAQVHPTEDNAWMVVPPLGSFFVAILALDIVHDALTAEDRAKCETVISTQIFKLKRIGNWVPVRLGTHGAWDIYQGTRTTPDDAYFNFIMKQITEDGVSPVTNHYAWERVGGGNSRISKSGYMDVLEFTGIDRRYYGNERIKKFMRWLFGSSVNCAKEMAIFGDMLPTQDIDNDMLHRRVVNFDAEAAGYAAWFLQDRPAPIGHIVTYILPQTTLPPPIVPASKLYANGGAFFREKADDPNGLHGVLYSIKSQFEGHTHFEVNGLALSALGNRLLVNGGRLGPTVQAAPLNNTLTINGENYDSKVGGGITAGFTTDQLDFASGNSGPALASSRHHRSLIMVHGSHGVGGYFVVLDEVETKPGHAIKNYLHPANQTVVTEVKAKQEYEAAIDHYPTVPGARLSIYYATAPDQVKIESVQSAVPRVYPGYPNHNRLESTYAAGPDGKATLATLLIPHRAAETKAVIQQTQESGLRISTVSHRNGAVVDRLYEASGRTRAKSGGVAMQAAAALVRTLGNSTDFLFSREGTYVSTGALGFESSLPVTLFMNAAGGAVVSSGGTLTLTGSGLQALRFDPTVEVMASGQNFIRVTLGQGTYRFARRPLPASRILP